MGPLRRSGQCRRICRRYNALVRPVCWTSGDPLSPAADPRRGHGHYRASDRTRDAYSPIRSDRDARLAYGWFRPTCGISARQELASLAVSAIKFSVVQNKAYLPFRIQTSNLSAALMRRLRVFDMRDLSDHNRLMFRACPKKAGSSSCALALLLVGCTPTEIPRQAPFVELPSSEDLSNARYASLGPVGGEDGGGWDCPIVSDVQCVAVSKKGQFRCSFHENGAPIRHVAILERLIHSDGRKVYWRWVRGWKDRCGILY